MSRNVLGDVLDILVAQHASITRHHATAVTDSVKNIAQIVLGLQRRPGDGDEGADSLPLFSMALRATLLEYDLPRSAGSEILLRSRR